MTIYAVYDVLWDSPTEYGLRLFADKAQAESEFEKLQTDGREMLDNGDYYIELRELNLE